MVKVTSELPTQLPQVPLWDFLTPSPTCWCEEAAKLIPFLLQQPQESTFPRCPSMAPGHRVLGYSTAAHFPSFRAWVMIFNFYLKINLLLSLMHRILAEQMMLSLGHFKVLSDLSLLGDSNCSCLSDSGEFESTGYSHSCSEKRVKILVRKEYITLLESKSFKEMLLCS